jgi:hypothetical protein
VTRGVMVSNSAARPESTAKLGAISLSEDGYRQVKSRLDLAAVIGSARRAQRWSIASALGRG